MGQVGGSQVSASGGYEIEVGTLRDWRVSGADHCLVDVREPWERAICAIAGSLSVPLNDLPARIGELSRELPLVLLCHHGARSLQATLWLRRQGFDNAVNLEGGIDAWAAQVDPRMERY